MTERAYDLTLEARGWRDGRFAPAAVGRFRLRDADGVLRGDGVGALAGGARVVVEAYQGRDDFAVGEGAIGGRVAGGLAWTGYGAGEFALKDQELRWTGGGRPGRTGVGVDAGATRMPLICWLKRASNGLAAIQVGGSFDEQLRLRFLDGETRLEAVDGSGASVLATGTELPQGEWRGWRLRGSGGVAGGG